MLPEEAKVRKQEGKWVTPESGGKGPDTVPTLQEKDQTQFPNPL